MFIDILGECECIDNIVNSEINDIRNIESLSVSDLLEILYKLIRYIIARSRLKNKAILIEQLQQILVDLALVHGVEGGFAATV